MKTVMITGNFDPLTDAGLDYIEQAMKQGDYLICIVSSDKQLVMKKGRVNIPQHGRFRLIDLVLKGLDCNHMTYINIYDNDTTLVAEALRHYRPDILFRGGDKTLDDMPVEERMACNDLGIKILHGEFRINRHGSDFR
jgi:cytidyltransferase-like protein